MLYFMKLKLLFFFDRMSLANDIQSNLDTKSLTNGIINDFANKVSKNDDYKAESLISVLSTKECISTLIDEIEALSK